MTAVLIYGECLTEMARQIPDASVDMVMCDLPYGTTQNKWDSIIPLKPLWDQYRRICKGAIVLTAAQPFTSVLVTSNLKDFKYSWVWKKNIVTGHLNAHRMPMRNHEDVCVFGHKHLYNPQGLKPYFQIKRRGNNGRNYGKSGAENFQEYTNFPRTIQSFNFDDRRIHPTQKPVALMEYLVRTYTHEGMTVLDNCMGSGTTAIACLNAGRNFIGIEKDFEMFTAARRRIEEAQCQLLKTR